MSKERLQDIKKKYNYERLGEFIDVKPVNTYELKWLIQQAELVQDLEELVEGYKVELMIKDNAKKRARQQNKRYREALKNILEDLDLNTMTVVNRDNFNWLIEQAERVEELELEVSDWRAEVQKWQKFYKESKESHLETKTKG